MTKIISDGEGAAASWNSLEEFERAEEEIEREALEREEMEREARAELEYNRNFNPDRAIAWTDQGLADRENWDPQTVYENGPPSPGSDYSGMICPHKCKVKISEISANLHSNECFSRFFYLKKARLSQWEFFPPAVTNGKFFVHFVELR